MKTCPLCNQGIKDGDNVVAILGAKYVAKDDAAYELQVSRQAILSHVVCPGSMV